MVGLTAEQIKVHKIYQILDDQKTPPRCAYIIKKNYVWLCFFLLTDLRLGKVALLSLKFYIDVAYNFLVAISLSSPGWIQAPKPEHQNCKNQSAKIKQS